MSFSPAGGSYHFEARKERGREGREGKRKKGVTKVTVETPPK